VQRFFAQSFMTLHKTKVYFVGSTIPKNDYQQIGISFKKMNGKFQIGPLRTLMDMTCGT